MYKRQHFAPNDTSVAAQLAKMKSFNPDVIIDATVGTSTATVLRAVKDAGMDTLPVSYTHLDVYKRQAFDT